jgi:tetratricopeptide (TPR) repeat protein
MSGRLPAASLWGQPRSPARLQGLRIPPRRFGAATCAFALLLAACRSSAPEPEPASATPAASAPATPSLRELLGALGYTDSAPASAAVAEPVAAPVAVPAPREPAPSAPGATDLAAPLPSTEPALQAISMLGAPLHTPELDPAALVALEERLEHARRAHEREPHSAERAIEHGRRLSALNRFREAVDVYSAALLEHPRSFELLRHRGHRWITLRQFERARDDLELAAILVRGLPPIDEPNLDPDPSKSWPSSVQHQIHYHLGLAHYLLRDYERALPEWREAVRLAEGSPDMLCGASAWLYATLRRLGQAEAASHVLQPIHAGLEVREAGGYLRLLLLYRGELRPSEAVRLQAGAIERATVGYGLANWYQCNGRFDEAEGLYRALVALPCWQAFGAIAAESELVASFELPQAR